MQRVVPVASFNELKTDYRRGTICTFSYDVSKYCSIYGSMTSGSRSDLDPVAVGGVVEDAINHDRRQTPGRMREGDILGLVRLGALNSLLYQYMRSHSSDAPQPQKVV